MHAAPHRLGLFHSIDRDGHYTRAGRADLRVMVAIVRQLAKAERSPMASIEDERDRERLAHRATCDSPHYSSTTEGGLDGTNL
jgi:hypothetical protein